MLSVIIGVARQLNMNVIVVCIHGLLHIRRTFMNDVCARIAVCECVQYSKHSRPYSAITYNQPYFDLSFISRNDLQHVSHVTLHTGTIFTKLELGQRIRS